MDNFVGFLQSFLSPVDGIRPNVQHPPLLVNYIGCWGQGKLQPQISSAFSSYSPKLLSWVLCLGAYENFLPQNPLFLSSLYKLPGIPSVQGAEQGDCAAPCASAGFEPTSSGFHGSPQPIIFFKTAAGSHL